MSPSKGLSYCPQLKHEKLLPPWPTPSAVGHHDLSWNPSTIEQRTGRVDRLRCKAEIDGESIHVYLPYLEGTADEKMYRVVSDRARWFQVVMGERYQSRRK